MEEQKQDTAENALFQYGDMLFPITHCRDNFFEK